MKKRIHQIIIGGEVMLLCMVVALLSTQAVSSNPPSNGVSYNKNGQVTVENALDNLYSKVNYGDAKASEILKGKKALVGGKEVIGTFTCTSLNTLGNATPEDIRIGKTAWVKGEKIVGTKKESLRDRLRIGDYIRYTPSRTSYIISKEETGFKYTQTINPSELNLWRVIRKNLDGTVEMVSYYSSNDKVAFRGVEAYKNSIGILNKIAKQYETEGITVGSRHMGYDETEKEYLTDVEANTELEEKIVITDYKLASTIGALRAEPTGAFTDCYYVASRFHGKESFGLYEQDSEAKLGMSRYFFPDIEDDSHMAHVAGEGCYVRPIVILKAGLWITGGNGKGDSPYTLEG